MNTESMPRTAGEDGWHLSRYNIATKLPGTDQMVIANLFRGNCAVYGPEEQYLLSETENLPRDHLALSLFRERGLIVDFDEQEALAEMGRKNRDERDFVTLTICTTMQCNFNCPYCFERHSGIDMSDEVQNHVVALAERMLAHFKPKRVHIIWFGGEPLLNPNVIWKLTDKLKLLALSCGATYSAGIYTNGTLLTQDILDRLKDSDVHYAVVAIDGVGEDHDNVRHFKDGTGSFDIITEKLRTLHIPFPVSIRHLLTEDNIDTMAPLEAYVKKLAAESGNYLRYAPDTCGWNHATDDRNAGVAHLLNDRGMDIAIKRDKYRFLAARGTYCGACSLADVSIDAKGKLYKCWPEMDNRDGRSFADAKDWDPIFPVETAENPEQLTKYLDTTLPNGDPECWECVWLPFCVGGCPYKRVNRTKECLPYKNHPDRYLLALYERMKEEYEKRKNA